MNKDLINDNIDLSQEILQLCATNDTLTQNYTMVNILFGVLLANFVEIYNLDAEIFTFDLYEWYKYDADVECIKAKFRELFRRMSIMYTTSDKLDILDIEWLKTSVNDIMCSLEGFILKDAGH